MAERTGCPSFLTLWSYVKGVLSKHRFVPNFTMIHYSGLVVDCNRLYSNLDNSDVVSRYLTSKSAIILPEDPQSLSPSCAMVLPSQVRRTQTLLLAYGSSLYADFISKRQSAVPYILLC